MFICFALFNLCNYVLGAIVSDLNTIATHPADSADDSTITDAFVTCKRSTDLCTTACRGASLIGVPGHFSRGGDDEEVAKTSKPHSTSFASSSRDLEDRPPVLGSDLGKMSNTGPLTSVGEPSKRNASQEVENLKEQPRIRQ